jgi:hypothetical protein
MNNDNLDKMMKELESDEVDNSGSFNRSRLKIIIYKFRILRNEQQYCDSSSNPVK